MHCIRKRRSDVGFHPEDLVLPLVRSEDQVLRLVRPED